MKKETKFNLVAFMTKYSMVIARPQKNLCKRQKKTV